MAASTSSASLGWRSWSWTDVGPKRERNEDALLARSEQLLWLVADGMGGHEAGQYASKTVVEQVQRCELPEHLGQCVNRVSQSLRESNQALRDYAQTHGAEMVGSTVVLLIARGCYCALLWAGDSRVYRIRNGAIDQLTVDHSHVSELVRHGHITAEQAENHPHANMITRAVGAAEELKIDRLTLEAFPGDRYILCSDGLSGVVKPAELLRIAGQASTDPAKDLVDAAIASHTTDNVTAVVIDAQ